MICRSGALRHLGRRKEPDLKLIVCYCSIFDECWKDDITTLSMMPPRVCEPPEVPFDEGLRDRRRSSGGVEAAPVQGSTVVSVRSVGTVEQLGDRRTLEPIQRRLLAPPGRNADSRPASEMEPPTAMWFFPPRSRSCRKCPSAHMGRRRHIVLQVCSQASRSTAVSRGQKRNCPRASKKSLASFADPRAMQPSSS